MSGRRELEAAVHICDQEKDKMNLLVLSALSPFYAPLDSNPENCATPSSPVNQQSLDSFKHAHCLADLI